MEKIERLNEIIRKSNRIVIFSGAGVSTESGIPDYRSEGGLYDNRGNGVSPEKVLSHDFFMYFTEEFYDFYKSKMMHLDAKPNPAHTKAYELEKCGKLSAVITQNIDGLYQSAGCKNVFELHGSVNKNTCMKCGKKYDARFVKSSSGAPMCTCGGTVKPDVVLYEEMLDESVVSGAIEAVANADCLIISGTSLAVYPAAGLIKYFKGENIVVINKDDIKVNAKVSLIINEKVGETMAQICCICD
ncbi:MAG: NAD-dependent protein deacylase [Clostridia bacterium]|nr:NAD-dependent protein deacylase [Clostridia bacterium]